MKTQILPNWCKKLGLTFFIIGTLSFLWISNNTPLYHDLNDGIKNAYTKTPYLKYLGFLELIGILIYFLSKEKIEDDYIQKLRLESYQITVILGLSLLLLLSVFFEGININSKNVAEFFLIVFLLVFYSKKRAE